MTTRLPPHDGAAFIAKLEQAIEDGNARFVGANMPRLETLIKKLQNRAYEIAQMQYRARVVRERYEPPAGER